MNDLYDRLETLRAEKSISNTLNLVIGAKDASTAVFWGVDDTLIVPKSSISACTIRTDQQKSIELRF